MPRWVEPPERRCATRRRRARALDRSKSEPSAATLASLSDCRTDTPPRSRRIHPCFAHAPSCLLVLSRDLPMIWLSSRCVIATLRWAPSSRFRRRRQQGLGELVGRLRKVTSWTCSLVRRSARTDLNELEGDVGLAPQELQEVTPLDDRARSRTWQWRRRCADGRRAGRFPNISPSLMMLRTTSRPSADAR